MIEHILNKSPYDGLVEQGSDMRLRVGVVDNPTYYRPEGAPLHPLNPIGIVNTQTGKICVRWLEMKGGLIQKEKVDGKMKTSVKYLSDHGEYGEIYEDTKNREILTLTHPFIWATNKNWCGFHYLPPVGSIVVVGFRKNNLPVLLGFIQSNYKACHKIKLGEIMIKGYGHNYTHWKQSDRLEHKVWAIINEHDLDDPNKTKVNDANCNGRILMDANDKFIRLDIDEIGKPGCTQGCEIKIATDKIYMYSWHVESGKKTTVTITPNEVTVNTDGDIHLNPKGNVYVNGRVI